MGVRLTGEIPLLRAWRSQWSRFRLYQPAFLAAFLTGAGATRLAKRGGPVGLLARPLVCAQCWTGLPRSPVGVAGSLVSVATDILGVFGFKAYLFCADSYGF